jgi:hypothetical protein
MSGSEISAHLIMSCFELSMIQRCRENATMCLWYHHKRAIVWMVTSHVIGWHELMPLNVHYHAQKHYQLIDLDYQLGARVQ